MTPSERARRLLRWYPPAWRRRYGDEFAALLDDSLGDAAPSIRLRVDVIRSGVAIRLRETGLTGDVTPPSEWIRAGALTVLCAWAVFVVAGIGLQKTSEHWEAVVSGSAHTWAGIAFGAAVVLAGVASLLVVAGAVAALPAVARFRAAGGWRAIRRPVVRAAATCGVTVVALAGAVWWARRLSEPQRNGADLAYSLAALGFALLLCASIATVTAAGVDIVRRLDLSPRVVRVEGRLAEAVTVAMVLMAVCACVWWGVMASAAPSFFGGVGPMSAIAGLMLGAVVLAAFGTHRVLKGIRA